MPNSSLDGIKVLDLTHHIAGPYCTKLLADFGAEVTKIEHPVLGDPTRQTAPLLNDQNHPDASLPFLYLNTNKRSVTLNLKTVKGRDVLKRMTKKSDLVIENFNPNLLPSLGLSYQDLHQINPKLVMVSISNFGQTGPYRNYEATDIIHYALGGLMYIFGSNLREPLKHSLHQAQFKAGVNAASAATIALYHQQKTSQGQWVDISIQECVASGLRDTISMFTYMGAIRRRRPERSTDIPRSPVKVKDGYIVPVHFGEVDWDNITDFISSPKLKEEKFSTPERRLENSQELQEIVGDALRDQSMFDLFYAAHQRRGFIYGVVQSAKDVVENPQYRSRDYFVEIDHPVVGSATYPGAPFLMSQTPWAVRSPAPTLGQHTTEILCGELGYSAQELAILKRERVV